MNIARFFDGIFCLGSITASIICVVMGRVDMAIYFAILALAFKP